MNSLFKSLNPQAQQAQPNMMEQFQQFKQNPMQFLMQKNVGIPQQFQNDPRGAVQYLMSNGQMSQQQFGRLSQMAQMMGLRL